MSRELATAPTDAPLDEALKRMRTRSIRRLPVVSTDGRLVGLVALDDILDVMSEELGDLVALVAREQRGERDQRPPGPSAAV